MFEDLDRLLQKVGCVQHVQPARAVLVARHVLYVPVQVGRAAVPCAVSLLSVRSSYAAHAAQGMSYGAYNAPARAYLQSQCRGLLKSTHIWHGHRAYCRRLQLTDQSSRRCRASQKRQRCRLYQSWQVRRPAATSCPSIWPEQYVEPPCGHDATCQHDEQMVILAVEGQERI